MVCSNCEEQLAEDAEEPDCPSCPLRALLEALDEDDLEVLELYGRLNNQLTYDFGLAPAVFELAGPKTRDEWGRVLDRMIRIHAELHPTRTPEDAEP